MNLKLFATMAAAVVLALTVLSVPEAEARRRPITTESDDASDQPSVSRGEWPGTTVARTSESNARSHRSASKRTTSSRREREASNETEGYGHHSVGARPGAWCGWYMRTRHGGGPEMNLAWNWRHYGSPGSPQVGAIVVWAHHVGEIVGQASNGQWIVLSGNDSHRVRQRPRSIAGAVVRI